MLKTIMVDQGKRYLLSTAHGIAYAVLGEDGWWYLYTTGAARLAPDATNIIKAYKDLGDILKSAESDLASLAEQHNGG